MIQNRRKFYCLCCSSVARQEVLRLPPFCCAQEMGEEILRDDFAHELDLEPPVFFEPRLAPRWSNWEVEHDLD